MFKKSRLSKAIVIFSLFIVEGAWSQVNCVDLFDTRSDYEQTLRYQREVDNLISAGKLQEAVWSLQDHNRPDQAYEIERRIRKILGDLDGKTISAHEWEIISTGDNIHSVFLIESQGLKVVIKFGDFSSIAEPLAFEIARLLRVKAPTASEVTINNESASVQTFIDQFVTPVRLMTVASPNLAIQLFDRLTLNWDRNQGNILLDLRALMDDRKQIAIDNEFIFEAADSAGYRREGPNAFLLENLPEIRAQFPETHAAMLDPQTEHQIIALMEDSPLPRVHLQIDYVRQYFQAYRSINRIR